MRPMSPFGKPFINFVHVPPAFGDLYTRLSGPPPTNCPTARRRCHVEAYSTSALFGSITMSLPPVSGLTSSTAFQVAPPSVVLKMPRSPPEDHSGPCAATYTTFELRGSIWMRPMCSDFSRPTRFHVVPASVDL